jgi:subtilisin-like proprotein convertase family protein
LISSGSIISGNRALANGGGVFNNASGQLTFNNVTLNDNTSLGNGGGFFNNGTAALAGMSVRNNEADQSGGGLYNDADGRLNVETSTVISNTTLGAQGGGIGNLGVLTVTRSALIYNVASVKEGGSLNNAGTAQLTNVTVSDNVATAGGGIQNSGGTLTLQYTTVSTNTSPALNNAAGTVSVGNSILEQLTGSACGGAITSADYNMDRGTSCGFNQTHDLSNTDPQMGSLRDNGGDSPTRAIAFTSPAVDMAGTCPSPAVDQRSIARPQGDACDRGAYEVAGYSNPNPIDIGAHQCVTSFLTINDQFAVGRLLTGANLTHGNRADLTVRLLSPGSRTARLLGPAANSGQNLDTLFDDSIAQGVPAGDQNPASPFYENAYQPATPLQLFIGVGVRGAWRLEVCNSGSSMGTLNRWVLVIPEVSDFKIFMPAIRRNK